MMESLRGLGYSTAAALADLVDNSISAGASDVRVDFFWDGRASRITVLDNGTGMDDSELETAMRLGALSPVAPRNTKDLGRFGIGLKAASFSQCRRLTVASLRQDGEQCCMHWDLDLLAARPSDGWQLQDGPSPGSASFLAPLARPHGTLVLWENLDRIVTPGFRADDFLDLADTVERRLGMLFHRFLEGPDPTIRISLNDRPIAAWDPFMSGHLAKSWTSPIAHTSTPAGRVEVECHVLPHRDRLSPQEHELAGGPEGWTSQQGFYIYRNRRLISAGGWLGLGTGRPWNREEPHRLARIRVDIPNSADAEWRIDIRKSVARPPASLRTWLTSLAADTRERARKVFAHRGSPTATPDPPSLERAWRADHLRSGIRYRINAKHPAIAAALAQAAPNQALLKAMLRVLEETLPVQQIWLDTAERREVPDASSPEDPPENAPEILQALFDSMTHQRGLSAAEAIKVLLRTEPFQNFPDLVNGLCTSQESE